MTKRGVSLSRLVIAVLLLAGSLVAGWTLLSIEQARAQEKHRYSFKTPPGVSKYTQQHVIDVGDVPGHQVRVYEIHTKYTGDAPVYDGVKVAETWTRGWSDYTNGNGHNQNYAVNIMENGDRIITRADVVAQAMATAGSTTAKFTSVITLTGGTGKFKGIRGTLRGSGQTDFKTGTSGVETEGEYWIEK